MTEEKSSRTLQLPSRHAAADIWKWKMATMTCFVKGKCLSLTKWQKWSLHKVWLLLLCCACLLQK